MGKKLQRKARKIVERYMRELAIDPDMARSNLEQSLNNRRNKLWYMVESMLSEQLGEEQLND